MSMKTPLSFRPSDEEEYFLRTTGKLNCWTDTCRKWIRQDMKKERRQIFSKSQNGFILIIMGIMCYGISAITPFNNDTIFFIGILIVMSIISVTAGVISILWEAYHHVKR